MRNEKEQKKFMWNHLQISGQMDASCTDGSYCGSRKRITV